MADPNAIAAAAAAAAALAQAPPPVAPPPVAPPPVAPVTRAFKPYGSPPPFDLEAERDSFPIWEARWDIFLALSTIDEALDVALRPAYKTNQLKSCLSTPTLQAVLSAGLTAAQLADHTSIINLLRTRCNAGRNRHVWRHQFALLAQLPNQTADNWLCSLRDISRKCDFGVDCCANCEPTRILGQLIAGVADNAVRIKLLTTFVLSFSSRETPSPSTRPLLSSERLKPLNCRRQVYNRVTRPSTLSGSRH